MDLKGRRRNQWHNALAEELPQARGSVEPHALHSGLAGNRPQCQTLPLYHRRPLGLDITRKQDINTQSLWPQWSQMCPFARSGMLHKKTTHAGNVTAGSETLQDARRRGQRVRQGMMLSQSPPSSPPTGGAIQKMFRCHQMRPGGHRKLWRM